MELNGTVTAEWNGSLYQAALNEYGVAIIKSSIIVGTDPDDYELSRDSRTKGIRIMP